MKKMVLVKTDDNFGIPVSPLVSVLAYIYALGRRNVCTSDSLIYISYIKSQAKMRQGSPWESTNFMVYFQELRPKGNSGLVQIAVQYATRRSGTGGLSQNLSASCRLTYCAHKQQTKHCNTSFRNAFARYIDLQLRRK